MVLLQSGVGGSAGRARIHGGHTRGHHHAACGTCNTRPHLGCVCDSRVLVGRLEERGYTVDMVEVFMDGSGARLPLSTECVHLAGSVLHVRG